MLTGSFCAGTLLMVSIPPDKSNGKQVKGKFVTESGYVGDKGTTITTKILEPSSKVVTSPMVGLQYYAGRSRQSFFQVNTPHGD